TAVQVETRLAELDFGSWEGRSWADLRGATVDRWMRDPWQTRPPGGETVPEMTARIAAFRSELLSRSGKPAVVVTHAGVIRIWRSLAEKRELPSLFAEAIPHGSIWEVT